MRWFMLITCVFLTLPCVAGTYTKEEQKILQKIPGSVMSSMRKYTKKFDKAERPAKLVQTAKAYTALEDCKGKPAYDHNMRDLRKWLEKNNKDKGNYYFINRDFQANFKIYDKLDKEIEAQKGNRARYRKLQKCRDYYWLYSMYPLSGSTKCPIWDVAKNTYRNVNGYMGSPRGQDDKVKFTSKYRGSKTR
jgi:hypothetical protein